MNVCLFATLIAVMVNHRSGSLGKAFLAGFLVVCMHIIWVFLMAERETQMALEAEEREEAEKKDQT